MKKILPVLVLSALAVGCSESQSAENARVRQAHQQVNELLGQAALSYVPGAKVDVSQSAWRQQQQAKAMESLQAILKEGSPAQQVTTRRLMADIEDSAARVQVNQAVARWTELSGQSALLMSFLMSVDRADAQLRSFSVDDTDLIASLRSQSEEIRKQREAHGKDLEQWQAKVRDLTTKAQAARKEAQQSSEQAAQLRTKAFSQSGAERLASYEKASQAEMQANKASAQAQNLEVQLDIASSTAAILDRQVKLADEAIANSQNLIKDAEKGQVEQANERKKAQDSKQQAIDELDSRLATLVTAYQQVMNDQFQPALARLDKAIELLDGALPLTSDSKLRREIQMDLLARKVSKLHLLSMQTTAAGDWASKLGVIHEMASDAKRPGGAMIPAKATFYETTAQSARNVRDQASSLALTTASEATELANQLAGQGGEGDPVVAQAQSLASLVTAYTKQVNAASKG